MTWLAVQTGTACSRNRDFQYLRALGQRHFSGLEPESERLLCIRDRFFFRVTGARAAGQLRKNGRPSLRLPIEFNDDAQLHVLTLLDWSRVCIERFFTTAGRLFRMRLGPSLSWV